MKVGAGLLNVLTVADSWENALNPRGVGIFDPVYGRRLGAVINLDCLYV